MKITSTYNHKPVLKEEYPSPRIKIFENDGTIVSFCAPNTGTILHVIPTLQCKGYYIGSYRTNWVESGFVPYYGEITIRSEPEND